MTTLDRHAFIKAIFQSQNGLILQSLAAAGGISIEQTMLMLDEQIPELAKRMRHKSRDREDFAHLLAALLDPICDAPLDDVRVLFNRSIIRDGEETLAHLYGTLEAAHQQADRICPVNGKEIVNRQMMTFAVNLTLAMMSKRRRDWQAGRLTNPSEDPLEKGVLIGLLSALASGILLGVKRSFLRRRKRLSYGRKKDLQRIIAPASPLSPSMDDLLNGL